MANKILKKSDSFYAVYDRKPGEDKMNTHYCPGCGHGNIHKYVAEAIDELGIQDRTIIVSPVGCSVFIYYYFDLGNIQVAHGRAPAVATALKRAHPHAIVISYQGDGDLAAIGGNNIIQAANRGEQITVVFVNNAIYGMTGGQVAPTTLVGMKSSTTPRGRAIENEGYPMKVSELIAALTAPVYVERTALWDTSSRNKAKRSIKKALKAQMEGKGFTFCEIMSPCPSGWKLTPAQSLEWMKENMGAYYKVGVLRDEIKTREPIIKEKKTVTSKEIQEVLGTDIKPSEHYPTNPEDRYKNPSMKFAGFGGQGVLSLGTMLANAAMEQGFNSSWIPSYGPEMRGGTAYCFVNISDKEIGSPTVSNPDLLVAFNRPSLEKFEGDVKPGGIIMYDSTIIDVQPTRDDVEILAVPATGIAESLGNIRCANTVMAGVYLAKTKIMAKEALIQTLPKAIKKKHLIDLNIHALEKGFEFIENN
ncbi:MAG: 2-ketoisovalerate ferredoxin oxidoreductase [Anaerolineaceae bacterium 4572_78]|nr:MAG: 2-ketoisovalerate ferredoxin oxidoreductase [Anaerolineaceae bacterium 4572_78]